MQVRGNKITSAEEMLKYMSWSFLRVRLL